MNRFFLLSMFCSLFLITQVTFSQENPNSNEKSAVQTQEMESEVEIIIQDVKTGIEKEDVKVSKTEPENTLEKCSDGIDNDGDGFIDCKDQDCQIFAICAGEKNHQITILKQKAPVVERGALCRDGIDNDGDGLTDCHDPKCVNTRYCRKIMYERLEDPAAPIGFFVSMGLGASLPNYNWKDIRVDSVHGDNIPFDPDFGVAHSLKIGVAPLKWMGFGVNFNSNWTFASNRADFISIVDSDDKYKYDGYKSSGHIGGFLRLQYPVNRIVPFVDIAAGFSYSRYKWQIHSPDTDWEDIDSEWMWNNSRSSSEEDFEFKHKRGRHFTLALEPGIDVFVIPRFLAVGARLWLPVYSNQNKGMDNVGVLFGVTLTPNWRAPKQLKPEYQQKP